MAEELQRHGITFSLDLNKHPKDATNLSLINAENFKVSEDGASLISDRNLNLLDILNDKNIPSYSKLYSDSYINSNIIELIKGEWKTTQTNEVVIINNDLTTTSGNTSYNNLKVKLFNEKIVFSNDDNNIYYECSVITSDPSSDGIIGLFLTGDIYLVKSDGIKISINNTNNIKIVYAIPANDEIVLFLSIKENINIENSNEYLEIIRYNERINLISDFIIPEKYDRLRYYGGKFSGTFTYNVKNELIITFCEYDSISLIEFPYGEPMKIINLGYWDNIDGENVLINTSNLNPKTLSLCPEVSIPNMSNISIDKGLSKKGWYHFYIRYKINKYDYTNWYSFGDSVYLDETVNKTIFTYYDYKGDSVNSSEWKVNIDVSNDSDIVNKTISFKIHNLSNIYEYYQIAFVCNTKIYNECKITNDIQITSNNYILNYKDSLNYDINKLINVTNNYYNVKNIINYNNRLYIANYNILTNELNNFKNDINIELDSIETDEEKILINVNGSDIYFSINNNKINILEHYKNNYSIYKVSDVIKKDITFSQFPAGKITLINNIENRIEFFNVLFNNAHIVKIVFESAYIKDNNDSKKIKELYLNNFTYRDIINNDIIYFYGKVTLFFEMYKTSSKINSLEYDIYNGQILNEKSSIIYLENSIDKIIKTINYSNIYNIKYYNKNDDAKFTLIPLQPYFFYIHYVNKYGEITDGYNLLELSNNLQNFKYINYDYLDRFNQIVYSLKGLYFISNIYKYNITDYDYIHYSIVIPYKKNINIINFSNAYVKIEHNGEITYNRSEDSYRGISMKNLIIDFINEYDKGNDNIVQDYLLSSWNNNISEYYGNELGIYINNYENNGKCYSIKFSNIPLLKGFDSYFISYAKLDKTLLYPLYVKNDENNKIENETIAYGNYLNYIDKIELDSSFYNNRLNLDKIEYKVANSYEDNNFGKNTNLLLKANHNIKDGIIHIFRSLYNNNITDNKTLIRVSQHSSNDEISIATYSFNGYINALIINSPYRINTQNKLINAFNPDDITSMPIENQKFIGYSYIPFTYEQINNPPKIYKTIINNVKYDEPTAKFYDSYLFLPHDTIDLFKNNALDYDESCLSIYSNYNENNVNQTKFIKTIRRSTFIKDESLENGWRSFESEAYQNIQENKGEITRIEGIGDLLLIHTKDSLFQFDKSNLLMTTNKNVQLAQGDTFDVGYKEIFTSPNGYGGLQDKDAAIVGEFGYIWYNNDFNKIYQYNAGSLNVISGNIEFLLNKYKPIKCKFVDDKQNKRLIIQFQLKNEQILNLTYNYDIKAFISFYINDLSDPNILNETYNTKTKFYILENNKVFNGFDKNNAKRLSFIINENYSKIKRLNFIKYKLYKRIDSSNDEFNANSPVEGNAMSIAGTRTPYSGYQLRVYNDLCDTGILDIHYDGKIVSSDKNKPYYDLGNFTFNYLRDKTDDKNQIFGNFFIVEFIFEPKVDQKDGVIEFESLEYSVSYEEN